VQEGRQADLLNDLPAGGVDDGIELGSLVQHNRLSSEKVVETMLSRRRKRIHSIHGTDQLLETGGSMITWRDLLQEDKLVGRGEVLGDRVQFFLVKNKLQLLDVPCGSTQDSCA